MPKTRDVSAAGTAAPSRTLDAQAAILERAARGEPLEEILDDLCRMVEDPGAGRWCTVLLIRDGAVHHVAAPGVPDSYTSAIEGVAIGPDRGSCGTAAYLGEPVLVDDIEHDPKWATWRELALQHGYRACWSYPVRNDGQEVVATFAAYSDVARMPTDEERGLLQLAARIASVLVSSARWREELEGTAERLARANAELQRRDRAKDDLLSVTSHELRTPLTPMTGLVETLAVRWDVLPDHERRVIVEVIRKQCHRLSHLVDDLLTMSVAAAGGLVGEACAVTVRSAIDDAVATVARDRGVEIDVPEALQVWCDPDHLHQILVNYLSNATKYAPDGPCRVTARSHDGEVVIEVADDGPGVPAELVPDLFEPFRHGADTDGHRGTGLGLSVVRSLVTANDGRAWYRGGEPRGARFLVALPEVPAEG